MTGAAGIRIRGAGVVCAHGADAATALASIDAGRCAFQGLSDVRAAYAAPFDAVRDLPRGMGRRLGRQLGMSIAAVLDAVGSARAWAEEPADTGIVAATAHGPIHETVEFIGGTVRDGPRYASPLLFSGTQHNAMVGLVARELGIRGPAIVVTNGEVSFETALLAAVAGLRAGRMRRAVVVGSDAYHPLYAKSLEAFGVVSTSDAPTAPWSDARPPEAGFHLGEGAGALVLEIGEDDAPGVRVDDVVVGCPRAVRPAPSRVEVLASGDDPAIARHRAALAALGADGARVGLPASLFGAFTSLSSVAIAVEAARRLRRADDASSTLFVSLPRDACAAQVVLSGSAGA